MEHYSTVKEILEECGFWHRNSNHAMRGTVDGTNRVFTVDNVPIVDMDNDDIVSTGDIVVYVDDTPLPTAGIELVDTERGIVTLTTAPAVGSTVSIDYYHSTVSMSVVEMKRSQVKGIIDSRMRRAGDCTPYTGDKITAQVKLITVMYVSALLLIIDYGNHQDIEGTSKDGYKRLGIAKKMLEDFAKSGGVCGDTVTDSSAAESHFEATSTDLIGEYKS